MRHYIKRWGYLTSINDNTGLSRWSRGLRRGELLGLRVRITSGCVLSGTGLCEGPITRPGESYLAWYVWVLSRNINDKKALAHWRCPVKRNMTIQPHNQITCSIITSVFTASIKILLLYNPSKRFKSSALRRSFLCLTNKKSLTLIVLMWRIGWAHNNDRK